MNILLIFLLLAVLFLIVSFTSNKKKKIPVKPFDSYSRKFLNETVEFYRELNPEEKKHFEARILNFLSTTKVIGVKTDITEYDKILVGASAIIPVFAFPKWEYKNLYEVLLYPSSFNTNYKTEGENRQILGMVGYGAMEGKMILSKPALHAGFKNDNDKKNVGIHEFIHLIDKSDGQIDGVPSLLLNKQYVLPWLKHVKDEMEAIHAQQSDVNAYGGVSVEEFFPVISEYFFERPKLLKAKHPELYTLLNEIFTVDLSKKYKGIKPASQIGRNDPCPCGSGKKFKNCCLA